MSLGGKKGEKNRNIASIFCGWEGERRKLAVKKRGVASLEGKKKEEVHTQLQHFIENGVPKWLWLRAKEERRFSTST